MRWLRAFPVLLAAAVGGCADPFGAGENLHVAVTVDRTVLSQTDSIGINVLVTNVSMQKVTIHLPGCSRNFQVTDAAGHAVAPQSTQPCLSILEVAELGPGESYSFDYEWGPTVSGPTHSISGTYYIRDYARTDERTYQSEPVEIRITRRGE